MKRTFRIARIALPLVLLGCIDFDGQTLTFRHDVKNDRLLIFQLYEGIHATGDSDLAADSSNRGKAPAKKAASPSEQEIGQLASVATGQRTFFFGNWITEYNRADCEKAIAEAAGGPASRSGATSRPGPTSQPTPAEAKAQAAVVALCQQLLASVKVTNGKFFLNGAKQLSAYQQVTIDQVSRLIAQANATVAAEFAADELKKFSPAEREKLRAFSAKGGRWVELNGGELRIRFWDEYAKFLEFRDDLLKQFNRGQIIVNYDQPLVEVIIGRPENTRTTLTSAAVSKPDRKLIEHVRKKYGLEKSVDVAALRDAFLGYPNP